MKVRPARIRESLEAMQRQVNGMENPLIEAGTFSIGSRVAYRHEGRTLEPINGQFLMNFEEAGTVIEAKAHSEKAAIAIVSTASEFFSQGVALEEDPESHDQAIVTYQKVLELDPQFAAAHINLGTIFYNRQDYLQAEDHYRKAIESDPRYALAYFDLGNVLDETGRMAEAILNYKTAIQLAPTYADAHYNLALAYEKLKQPRRALLHWRAYVKLDTSGPWAVHALHQIRRILAADQLRVVYRRGQTAEPQP